MNKLNKYAQHFIKIELMKGNIEVFKNEAADLMYHYLILLKAKGFTINDIEEVLMERGK
jgi:phosphoribosyl-ATP pyrophosphohydrolase/phosphoribosyl-AMP cyclohydrolase